MHNDYLNPAIRQLRDQQVRFAPREKKLEQVMQAEKLLGELDFARTYPYEYICYRVTNYRPESYPDLKLSGQEANHDLRLFVEDVSDAAGVPAEAAGRAGDDGRGAGQALQRLDEDHLPLAAAGAGQPALRDGRPQAGGVPAEFGRTLRGAQPGAGAPRLAVQPTDRRRAGDDHRAGPAACPRRRLPRRRHQAAGANDRPQRRDHPLHAEAVRPRSSRGGRVSRTTTGRCNWKPSARSISSTSAANRWRCWRSGSAARGPASTGSSPRCGPSGSWNCRWTTFPTRCSRGSARRSGRTGFSGRCRTRKSR